MRIAILDDDFGQAEFTQQLLLEEGHLCCCFSHGRALLKKLKTESFDLFVLDWNLPDISGREILQWIRTHDSKPTPVIFVSNRLFEADTVSCLDAGADDYLTKPLRPSEFKSRVAALLRRTYQSKLKNDGAEIFGIYAFNHYHQTVSVEQEDVQLTKKEFDLALLFFRNLGSPLSRQHLLDSVWSGAGESHTRTLDTHLSRIRTKLKLRPENGYRLIPVYSFGYRLDPVKNRLDFEEVGPGY
jgi:DNA-binding response OmpR family regulator